MKCGRCGAEVPMGKMSCEKCGAIVSFAQNNGGIAENKVQTVRAAIRPMEEEQAQGGAGFSIASMVLGIVSLSLLCIPFLPCITAVVGASLGGVSLHNKNRGRGQAIAGLTCSIIVLSLYAIGFAFGIATDTYWWTAIMDW